MLSDARTVKGHPIFVGPEIDGLYLASVEPTFALSIRMQPSWRKRERGEGIEGGGRYIGRDDRRQRRERRKEKSKRVDPVNISDIQM